METFIILGISGSGKGTQLKMVRDVLESKSNSLPVVELVMGDLFRKLWSASGYTEDLSKQIVDRGELQPSFLQINLWSNFFRDNLKGEEHLLIDGSPRRLTDAEAMDSAFRFYNRKKPNFVFLNVSREEAKKRLLKRAKDEAGEDYWRDYEDKEESRIEGRFDWYEEHVIPAIKYFENNEYYNFIEVDGERSVEEIHQEIIERSGI